MHVHAKLNNKKAINFNVERWLSLANKKKKIAATKNKTKSIVAGSVGIKFCKRLPKRKAIIHNVGFTSIEHGLVYLFVYCVAIFALVVLVQSVTKKHYISKFLRNIAAKPEHYKKKGNK